MIVETRDLTVRYPNTDRPALDGVSFGARVGELLAIVGPNGSGKTSLFRAVLGLTPTVRGTALIEGRDVREWSRAALARMVAAVPQREEIAFPLRVLDTVMLGRYAHLGPIAPPRAADDAIVRQALERCDAWSLRERRTDQLSGGEWQRVRVARALAQEPRVLLLDEPTASLDVRHEMEVFELARTLVGQGIAALVITHHLNLAARFADRMLLLDAGRLVAEGAPAAVLRHDRLAEVFGWPVAVTPWRDGSPQVVPLRPGESST